MFSRWIPKFLRRQRPSRARQQAKSPRDRGFHPLIERLEDRTVPSVTFQFDYSYDTSGWFTSERRAVLELAGSTLGARLNDALAAIAPGGADFWQATFWNPSTGTATYRTNLAVPANTLVIFVGAYAIDGRGGTIAQGGFGGAGNVTGSSAFQNAVRGRRTTPLDPARDFQPWGGQIAYDTSESWYFGAAVGATSTQTDFLSVTLHELVHILGFSEWNPSFASRISAPSTFTGPLAVAAYGGPVPLDAEHGGRSHWDHDVRHGGYDALLGPHLAPGQRRLLTGLDWAAIGDIGWELSSDAATGGIRSGPIVVAPDAGVAPLVRTFDAGTSVPRYEFYAYATTFTGGVRVAQGDVNGDGVPDIITAPGPGGGPHVRVFDGRTGALLREFFAYTASFTGGLFVAAGDVDGDGRADIITGADAGGGPHVRVFSGATGALLADFFAYDASFRGGVRVAVGDFNGDTRSDIITAAGSGGGPHVRVFSGVDFRPLASFFAFAPTFFGGLYVTAADLDGDGRAEIITGGGAGGAAHVQVFYGGTAALWHAFSVFDASFRGGVRVAAGDVNGDGRDDLFVAAGPGGGPHVRVFDFATGAPLADFYAFAPSHSAGVFLSGQRRSR